MIRHEDVRNKESYRLLAGGEPGTATMEIAVEVPQMLPRTSESFLGMCPKGSKSAYHGTSTSIHCLTVTVEMWTQPTCPAACEQIRKTHTVEFCLSVKKEDMKTGVVLRQWKKESNWRWS